MLKFNTQTHVLQVCLRFYSVAAEFLSALSSFTLPQICNSENAAEKRF